MKHDLYVVALQVYIAELQCMELRCLTYMTIFQLEDCSKLLNKKISNEINMKNICICSDHMAWDFGTKVFGKLLLVPDKGYCKSQMGNLE